MNRPRNPRPLPDLPEDSLALAFLVASDALAAVSRGHALNDGLQGLWRAWPALPAGTRGAVQDLLYGCLRDFGRGRHLLAGLIDRPLDEARIEALLLLALHRLEARLEQAHTIVDQAVEAAARIARGRLKGLVNGVLRNALRQWPELLARADGDPQARYRHPLWWQLLVKRAHPNDWETVLTANNTHPPMALRLNRRRTTLAAYSAQLEAAGLRWRALGEHALLLEQPCPVGRLPGFSEGLVSVQDWGAQQAPQLLDLSRGQRVLDACAAPGGKTAHLLETTNISLVALELVEARARRVEENLARLGLTAELRTADCRDLEAWWDGRPFDRILADVPCSASGVARRHPDIKWLRREEDVAGFATQQAEILAALWQVLAPGGKMLYLTCSLFPEENARQMARFAAGLRDCRRVRLADGSFEQQWLPTAEHDGFYFALLEKVA